LGSERRSHPDPVGDGSIRYDIASKVMRGNLYSRKASKETIRRGVRTSARATGIVKESVGDGLIQTRKRENRMMRRKEAKLACGCQRIHNTQGDANS
jgi:hypothetical protein